jgi:hypothetical protein
MGAIATDEIFIRMPLESKLSSARGPILRAAPYFRRALAAELDEEEFSGADQTFDCVLDEGVGENPSSIA